MRIVKLPKRKRGEYRTIYVPSREEKVQLRSIAGDIARKAERLAGSVVHGFTRGRNAVTNAQQHVGYAYTTCFDLKDFFDTVTERQLRGKLKKAELALVLVDGAARQGLPTSPAVANLAAADMDAAILKWCDKKGIVYTRYADDLAFSYNDPGMLPELLKTIPAIVSRCGFKINASKTRTMSAKAGRRTITGVAVDDTGVYPTRRAKRRLRAAEHQKRTNQARGLREWCAVKTPRPRQDTGDLTSLCQAWGIRKLPLSKLPLKSPAEDLGNGCIVTPDPVYMIGMSNWTTGWRSCMRHPDGQFRKGVPFWLFLRGTRIAALLSDKTMVVAGVERRVMRARALVHELRNGRKVYDRVYGNPADTKILVEQLRAAGYVSTAEAHGTVVGHAPARWRAYFDTLKSSTARATAGPWKGKKVRIVSC